MAAGFAADWVGFYRRNVGAFTKKDADTRKFRYVAKGTYEFKGERFEFPLQDNGAEQDRLMLYTYCRYVRSCRRFGVEPEPFVRVTKDS